LRIVEKGCFCFVFGGIGGALEASIVVVVVVSFAV
jgi:hypothetical protein